MSASTLDASEQLMLELSHATARVAFVCQTEAMLSRRPDRTNPTFIWSSMTGLWQAHWQARKWSTVTSLTVYTAVHCHVPGTEADPSGLLLLKGTLQQAT